MSTKEILFFRLLLLLLLLKLSTTKMNFFKNSRHETQHTGWEIVSLNFRNECDLTRFSASKNNKKKIQVYVRCTLA
jgi:hypothetical protein